MGEHMILHTLNKRGAALLQVLMITAILAGMSAMILRVSMSRTLSAKQAQHQINVQKAIESCMSQVNRVWAEKTPEAYARDLAVCQMCDPTADADEGCETGARNVDAKTSVTGNHVYSCAVLNVDDTAIPVHAVMEHINGAGTPCQITYVVPNGTDL